MATASTKSISINDRKIVVEALRLKHASVMRAYRAESDETIAAARLKQSADVARLIDGLSNGSLDLE